MNEIEYVYRVDTQPKLEKIQDNHFRARRFMGSGGYPHKLLNGLLPTLPKTDGIFMVCFFTSEAKAMAEQSSFAYSPGKFAASSTDKSLVLRCPKASILGLGLNESWDDALTEGDAYLFWIRETFEDGNANFSSTGIDFHQLEFLNEGQWHPLQKLFPEKVSASKQITPSVKITIRSVYSMFFNFIFSKENRHT